ncbi:transporter substrate-binding domain-containing protein [Bifidobacterium sp. ESL0763]|uniref:transporter substrate-binding domain-containing protein n=1 Tax=Bifidobacterium sp. ESL0763 TaxID=2983227 RepID=UPI0023F61F51|nr:transporter substrate-binding domain-containing protein [Bifidobacterium sp. ESL0763]MDF7663758.1 transporter substrate-binding domain-containing protein [Bifidobacterium sp. ESL0763]
MGPRRGSGSGFRRRRRGWRALAAALCGLTVSLGAACGAVPFPSAGVPQGPTIAIAVPVDEPGLGLLHEGRYSGFDIEVARYIAKKLGYANKQIVFKPVAPGQRASILREGKADMLVAALPADLDVSGQPGDGGIGVSKPYLSVPRGLMVSSVPSAPSDSSASAPSSSHGSHAFKDRTSFGGRPVCTAASGVDETGFAQYLPGAVLRTRASYQQCLTALIAGEADAVSADDALLHGLAVSVRHGHMRVLDSPAFTMADGSAPVASPSQVAVVRHAVAVRESKGELTGKIDSILDDMARDGSWRKAADTMFRTIGYRPDAALNARMRRR